MAKKDNTEDELSLDEAINAVRRLAKPERKNEELELLKQASAKLLEEVQPGFEFEDEEGGGGGSGAVTEELKKRNGKSSSSSIQILVGTIRWHPLQQ